MVVVRVVGVCSKVVVVVRVVGVNFTTYLGCTLPGAGRVLQLCGGPVLAAGGPGVGAALLGLGQGLRQAGLGHGLHFLQGLGQELEMNLHHRPETPAQHLGTPHIHI